MKPLDERYLEMWRLTKIYPGKDGDYTVVQDFDLTLREGEFVSIIGHSGCGKSTVLSMVAGLNDLTSGGIVVAGREISGPGPDRGVVFQSPSLLPWLTAFENVLLGVQQVCPNESRTRQSSIVEHYLELVGLSGAIHKYPTELSQGMRQRVGLARAFALNPKVLLLDEPFGMLDSITRIELQEVLIQLWLEDSKTALMVTHDVDEALFLSDRIVMMTNGPSARVGGILTVPFERPRLRAEVLEHPSYFRLRETLTSFLEEQETGLTPQEDLAPLPDSTASHLEEAAIAVSAG
jgi:nitrate/nitrite transport system ATP-binding protein